MRRLRHVAPRRVPLPGPLYPQSAHREKGGHADQLSRSYEVMDKYRIRSLTKILESDALKDEFTAKYVYRAEDRNV